MNEETIIEKYIYKNLLLVGWRIRNDFLCVKNITTTVGPFDSKLRYKFFQ